MSRLSRTHKIIIVVALAVILVVVLVVSCTPKRPREESVSQTGNGTFAAAQCAPPLACGPHYAGYIPTYIVAHPSYSYLTPYGSLYSPVVVAGGSYRARANVTPSSSSRSPMPYPSGYRPVPGDFVPPTAPASGATPAASAPATSRATAPASAPTQRATAPATVPTGAAPATAAPDTRRKQATPKTETKTEPKKAAPKVPTRSRIGR